MAWATSNGMVGTVAVELTGSARWLQQWFPLYGALVTLTAVVTFNCRFHQCFHPFPDDRVGVRIEHMSLVI